MKCYSVDNQKRKKVYNDYIKSAVLEQGWFVEFSYIFEKILLGAGIILGILNLINVIFSREPLFLLFLIITCGFSYGFSLIFKAIYREWTIKEYKYRGTEKIALNENSLEYSYDSPLSNIRNVYLINFLDIENIEYDSKKHKYCVFGKISFKETVQGEIISEKTIENISILDIFNKDLNSCFNSIDVIKKI